MTKRAIAVSRASRDALAVLGSQIKQARLTKGWTLSELAGRIGIDARTLSSVEAGSSSVAIGTAFNAAFAVGVNLFGLEGDDLALARRRGEETLALLPAQARTRKTPSTRTADQGDSDDDF